MFFFRVAEQLVPLSWNETIKIVKDAANVNNLQQDLTCQYECNPNKDGRSFSYNY